MDVVIIVDFIVYFSFTFEAYSQTVIKYLYDFLFVVKNILYHQFDLCRQWLR